MILKLQKKVSEVLLKVFSYFCRKYLKDASCKLRDIYYKTFE